MNKKEQAEMESLREQLRLAKALCWPAGPKPMPMTEEEIQSTAKSFLGVVVGWFAHGHKNGFGVQQGCSNGTTHSSYSTTKTSTKGGGRMFTTRDEAYLMARWEVCESAAKLLAQLDKEWEAGK